MTEHYCEWWYYVNPTPGEQWEGSLQCGKPAHFVDPRLNVYMRLCAEHYDIACALVRKGDCSEP